MKSKKQIDITYGVSIKSVISEMINMWLKSDSTIINYKKVEKMWNYFSDDTGAFPKLNKMDKNDIEGASGTQLVTSLNIFSTWMLNKFRTVLDVRKKLGCSP